MTKLKCKDKVHLSGALSRAALIAIASISLVLLLLLVLFSLGLSGGMSTTQQKTTVEQGTSLATVGRGTGFLPEWEVTGDMTNDIRSHFFPTAPSWILTGESAAEEHLIEKMTGGILSQLPDEVAEAAQAKIAPRIYFNGEVTSNVGSRCLYYGNYSFQLELKVSVVYYSETVVRMATLKLDSSIYGMYPANIVHEHIATKAAEMVVEALKVMYKGK